MFCDGLDDGGVVEDEGVGAVFFEEGGGVEEGFEEGGSGGGAAVALVGWGVEVVGAVVVFDVVVGDDEDFAGVAA